MLPACLSNIALHPALRNFSIEIRELCESPGNKFTSINSDGNWGNANVHALFYGSLLPYANKNKIL